MNSRTMTLTALAVLLRLLHSFLLLVHVNGVPTTIPIQALPTLSGYLPVTTTTPSSSIFYTYYEAQNSTQLLHDTPILIWLQGGPGCSSMLGNFYELGPWRLTHDSPHELKQNPGSWNRIFGLLFLDNPVGTGFSIAATPESIPTDQHTVAKHLYAAITKFIRLDSGFKNRPIFITGESYAGKYVPAIGSYIMKQNSLNLDQQKSDRVNLAGVAIGNGLTDPATQVATHALNAYYSGLINEKQKTQLEQAQIEAVSLTKQQNWTAATDARTKVLHMLQNMTGLATLYDFTRLEPYEDDLVTEFLKSKEIKQLLNANSSVKFEACSYLVGEILHADVMKSVKSKVDYMLKRSRVLLYQGHHDLRDGVVSVEAWVKKLEWGEIGSYLTAERRVWKVGSKLAGYVQKWDNLSQVVVLGAGHLVPTDQALNSQAMIEDWVLERGLFGTNGQSESIKSF